MVKFRNDADLAAVSARHGLAIRDRIPGIDVYLLAIQPGAVVVKVAELQGDPDVEFAETNGVMSVPEQP